MAKTRALKVASKGRTRQVFRWLQRVFPAPRDERWTLEWVSDGKDFGGCDWQTNTLTVDPNYPIEVVIETLLHEWGHVRDDRPDEYWRECHEHDDHFWIIHGRIYRRAKEEGGLEESKTLRSR